MFRKLSSFFQVILFAVFLLPFSGYAQETIIPLGTNPILQKASKSEAFYQLIRTAAIDDTLILPFVDDFSRQGIYPFDSLWLDSNVFINTNYPDRPITIGVATFDGLTKFGVPYNPSGSTDAIADYLTSRPIDLGVLAGDTSVWLSFFYQPQGLGDVPETADSLRLEIKDSTESWNLVWSLAGRTDTAFRRANIHLLDGKYFFKGFQFRFSNIATVNGNRDHWNVDYVILRQFGAANDSIVDNGLIRPQASLLNEYSAMPYPHYKYLGAQAPAAMRTSLADTIHDINYGGTVFTPALDISQNGTSIFQQTPGFFSTTGSQTYIPFAYDISNFSYPIQSGDSIDFLVRSYFSQQGTTSLAFNDTSFYHQYFHNYYAYDDGSAEVAYGLTGNTDVSMAYKFDVKMRDTLVGVQIYFNPVGVDVTNKLFQLCAWSSVDAGSNSSSLIYRRIDQKPGVNDSINGFKTFTFDSLIIVDPGPIWIGLTQNEPATQYGVGLDRNTDSHGNMYYHVDGFWHQSSVVGSWMIRPVFGSHLTVIGVDELSSSFNFNVFPNPATTSFSITLPKPGTYGVQVLDLAGRIINSQSINNNTTISTAEFSAGVYFVRLTNEHNLTSVQKLIIQ